MDVIVKGFSQAGEVVWEMRTMLENLGEIQDHIDFAAGVAKYSGVVRLVINIALPQG